MRSEMYWIPCGLGEELGGGWALISRLCDFFFFQAEDGIRDLTVTGVQTCALPISRRSPALYDLYQRLPLTFERNAGQTDRRVKFLARGPGYTLFLTGDEAVLSLRDRESVV